MKKLFLPILLVVSLALTYSCGSLRSMYTLTEGDAASAIREMLGLGTRESLAGSFTKDNILTTIFPSSVAKTLNTLNQFGLTTEVDRFTTTLSTAAEKSATASIPIFVNSINNMKITDAIRIVKSGGTAATDYLRSTSGDSLRRALKPVMQQALDEYKLTQQWNDIVKPIKIGSSTLNLDLANLMAGAVSEAMFRKIADKEVQVRSDASARTTSLLQKVFSRNWNQ